MFGFLVTSLIVLGFCQAQHDRTIPIPCYDRTGKPQKCVPEFLNAAFRAVVEATNTCGMSGRTDYCIQTESTQKYCSSCYPPGSPEGESHPPEYLTDFDNEMNHTWWQSETMLEEVQYPNQVNLTLHLMKAYDITYVRLLFQSPRPESFTIYKRTTQDGPWIPYQYFSATCRDTYGLQPQVFATKGDETRAFCTSEYSDMTPLSRGSVPFSTLEGRPSAYNFENSPELQEWVTATDIRITFDRLNTFGDELWKEPVVLKSYFYAVTDLAVGARCKCNGHASECPLTGNGWERRCRCEHNTAGPDCNECLPFYNDAPWSRATKADAHECRACNCNGFSNRCYFDKELYEKTGHGGHCIDCAAYRDGPNCERCRENFYQQEGGHCVACNCNEMGSRSQQCNSEGKCQCKMGVTGEKCDRCDVNYYDFGPDGCKPCNCSIAGSYKNEPHCDSVTGTCSCKENVEGKRCHECKPGFFSLDEENEFGCTPCFCYGQSSICKSTSGYSKVVIESSFARSNEKWSAADYVSRPTHLSYNGKSQTIGVHSQGHEPIYFLAPQKFLGDQRGSYNQDLEFKLRTGEPGAAPTIEDIVLQGGGLSISQPIFGQHNPLPSTEIQQFKFRLNEHPDYGWQPRLSSRDFMSVLANLTAIKIRGTYFPQGVGFLDEVKLKTARRGAAGQPATWIETCTCPAGYIGQFCESCAHKYRHEPPNGGPFARCVPCNCNGHADSCEEDTGRCICQHNTEGENCEFCARGFYGNSLEGTPDDCKACPCPENGACLQVGPDEDNVVCLECPLGYGGPRCDLCSDGYFGDPNGTFGEVKKCQPCDCNTNVDPNAVGNCNRTSGECLKCIYNTGGRQCDQCLPGYFGDALAIPKGDCKLCQCYRVGTVETETGPPLCDQLTGQCQCKAHVHGVNCDTCEDGYFNIASGEGCEPCSCDLTGSINKTCDMITGQCHCRPGVVGKKCDQCAPYYYGFSTEGCKSCDCDPVGSSDLQCDPSGQCPCLDNVEGRQCDRCKENKFDRQRGCLDCEPCYNLVRDAANIHRGKLAEFEKLLEDITNSPTVIEDPEFEGKLKNVQMRVEELEKEAKTAVGAELENDMSTRLSDVSNRLQTVKQMLEELNNFRMKGDIAIEHGNSNVTIARTIVDRADDRLQEAFELVQTDGNSALQRAIEKSEELGQENQQMSEISQEARHLANEHKKVSELIKQIADKSENISTEAYEMSRDAIKKQRNATEELESLKSEIGRMEEKVKSIKATVEGTQNSVDQAQMEALNVFGEIHDLQLPEIMTDKLKEESEFLINSAAKIKKEAEDLLQDHTETWDELSKQIEESQLLLDKGKEQRKDANELFESVDMARNKSKEAVNLDEQIFREAWEILGFLTGYDGSLRSAIGTAVAHLNQTSEIERRLDEIRKYYEKAEMALQGPEFDAVIARDSAKEAQSSYAEEASKEAQRIKTEAEETKQKAVSLRDEADALAGRVAVTESRLKKLEEKSKLDEDLTMKAKKKVGQTKVSVTEASKQVQKAIADVDTILNELKDLSDVDEESLDDLERRLEEAEQDVNDYKLDEGMQLLKEEKMSQFKVLNQYQEEVDRLRNEVFNIERIANSLPEGCFKREFNLEL